MIGHQMHDSVIFVWSKTANEKITILLLDQSDFSKIHPKYISLWMAERKNAVRLIGSFNKNKNISKELLDQSRAFPQPSRVYHRYISEPLFIYLLYFLYL